MIRPSRLLLAVLAPALFIASAHAQFSLYGEFTVDRLAGISSSPVLQTLAPLPCPAVAPATQCTTYNDHANPLGGTFGVSYDFKTFGPVTLAADLRASLVSAHQGAQTYAEGSGAHIYTTLGGVKATFKTPIHVILPYVQGSFGYARSNYGVLTNASHNGTLYPPNPNFPGIPTQNNFAYNAFGGVDLRFLPWADWRVAELGVGAIQATGNFAHTYPVYTISSGVVFHIPSRP